MARGTKLMGELSVPQRLFAYAYFNNGGNGAEAAAKAGYSAKAAKASAYQLLKNPAIQALLTELQAEVREKVIVSKEELLLELKKIGFSDIRTLFDENSRLRNIKDLPDEIASTLSSVDIDELWGFSDDGRIQIGQTKKVKMWDKLKALSQIADILGYNAPAKVAAVDSKGKDVKRQVFVIGGKEIEF